MKLSNLLLGIILLAVFYLSTTQTVNFFSPEFAIILFTFLGTILIILHRTKTVNIKEHPTVLIIPLILLGAIFLSGYFGFIFSVPNPFFYLFSIPIFPINIYGVPIITITVGMVVVGLAALLILTGLIL